MAGDDPATRAFYEERWHGAYRASLDLGPSKQLRAFLDQLVLGATILELGTGGGRDGKAIADAGYRVDITDGCAAMAEETAKRIGHPVHVLRFRDLNAEQLYDGIWAQACLLHVERAALPEMIGRVYRALKPGGVFFASYKAGEAEGRDRWGRLFNYPDPDWLHAAYFEAVDWASFDLGTAPGHGYNGEQIDWHSVTVVKGKGHDDSRHS